MAVNKDEATGAPPSVPDSTFLDPVKAPKAVYPLQAAEKGIQGQVWLVLHVSEAGDVESADVLSGAPVLAQAAVNAAKKWKFKPFIKNGKAIKVTTKMPFDFFFRDKLMDKGVSVDGTAVAEKDAKPAPSGVPDASSSTGANSSTNAEATNLPKRARVSQGVSQGLLVRQIAPVYPAAARQNRVQGSVVLQAVIGKDGRIQDLRVVSGREELIPAAVGAVQQWRYKPYLLLGEPVEVETQITINFALSR